VFILSTEIIRVADCPSKASDDSIDRAAADRSIATTTPPPHQQEQQE
jgi:hypothetical protein